MACLQLALQPGQQPGDCFSNGIFLPIEHLTDFAVSQIGDEPLPDQLLLLIGQGSDQAVEPLNFIGMDGRASKS